MDLLLSKRNHPFFLSESSELYMGDSLRLLPKMPAESVDMIFADPPYFLSNDGITCRSGRMTSVNKGEWDEGKTPQQRHCFNRMWIRRCRRVLKPDGTIWISGTFHNIYSIGMALEQEGFRIINNITWQKTNPPPNLSCRCFTHSTETILWAQKDDKKAKHRFNYSDMKEMNGGHQMKDVWTGPLTPPKEKRFGSHPTQKPEYLLERIVLASTVPGDLILDPFCGTGTTGAAAIHYGRRFVGFDLEADYLETARKRLNDMEQFRAGL